MKKHFLSLPLSLLLVIPFYAQAESSSTTPELDIKKTASSTEEVTATSPDQDFTLCQQQAIEARDTQISSSRSLYNTAMTNALTDRKNKEKAAIAISDKDAKKTAIKTSVETYKTLTKNAQNDLTEARKVAWQSFEDAIQSCRDVQTATVEETLSSVPSDETTESPASTFSASQVKKEVKETPDEGSSLKNMFKAFKSLFD
jgi:DNA repair ATPase RecN